MQIPTQIMMIRGYHCQYYGESGEVVVFEKDKHYATFKFPLKDTQDLKKKIAAVLRDVKKFLHACGHVKDVTVFEEYLPQSFRGGDYKKVEKAVFKGKLPEILAAKDERIRHLEARLAKFEGQQPPRAPEKKPKTAEEPERRGRPSKKNIKW